MSTVPNTKLYIGNILWSKNSKHKMLFKNITSQTDYIKSKLNLVENANTNIIRKNTPFIIKCSNIDLQNSNYLMYQNNDISTKWYYAYIDRIEYIADDTVKIYHTCDVWQTYCFDIRYKTSRILRGHIAKADDVIGANTESEPISSEIEISKILSLPDVEVNNWTPKYVVNAVSWAVLTDDGLKWLYGGVGNDETLTGSYSYYLIAGITELNAFLTAYASVNRANDITGVYALPKWVTDSVQKGSEVGLNAGLLLNNDLVTHQIEFDYSSETALPCGYTPKNNKLFTSLALKVNLINYNGLNINFKPELLTDRKITCNYSMRPYNADNFKITVSNYADKNNSYFDVPYSSLLACAYNSNTGITKALNVIGSISSVTGSIANTVTAGTVNSVGGALSSLGIASSSINAYNSLKPNINKISGTNDSVNISKDNMTIRCQLQSPTLDNCQMMDNYLTMYGYALNEIAVISDYMTTRSVWNYIQTDGCNIEVNAPNDDIEELKQMFDSGVTFWHDASNFCNYNIDND